MTNLLHDTDLGAGDQPLHQVMIWNGLHDRRKLYKAYRDKNDAEIAVAALRLHGMDAELVTMGAVDAGDSSR